MLILLVVDLLGTAGFGSLYLVAGLHRIGSGAFLGGLAVLFALVTALWVRGAEQGSAGASPIRRLGRAAVALGLTVVGVPVAILMPLGHLEERLPPDLRAELHLPAVFALLLVSLALLVASNALGALVVAGRGMSRRRGGTTPA